MIKLKVMKQGKQNRIVMAESRPKIIKKCKSRKNKKTGKHYKQ